MAKRKTLDPSLVRSAEPLYREIRAVLESARAGAYRAVNAAMVQAYWNIGRLIVEHEQGGHRRAGYGKAVIATLAERLTRDMGRGFDERNLWYMRSFHLAFPILNAPRSESPDPGKRNAVRSELEAGATDALLRPELSWTHYRLLLSVEDPQARDWYAHEAAEQHWSTRQLERQISVLYYERLLASRRKAPVRKEGATKLASVEPEQVIRDPYVQYRLHQQAFRLRVVEAYRRHCAVCRLKHQELLEAAHILPDGHPRGEPIVPNGISEARSSRSQAVTLDVGRGSERCFLWPVSSSF